jgi:hypothetical protein
MAKTGTGTMTREVRRLERAGILRSRAVGRTKLVRAKKDAPFYRALRDLVVIVLGPAEVPSEELMTLEGIEAAAIFGSWAARAAGEAGPSPVDIDLLVIGRPDRDDLQGAFGEHSGLQGPPATGRVLVTAAMGLPEDSAQRRIADVTGRSHRVIGHGGIDPSGRTAATPRPQCPHAWPASATASMSRSAASSAVTGLKLSVRCGLSIVRTDDGFSSSLRSSSLRGISAASCS